MTRSTIEEMKPEEAAERGPGGDDGGRPAAVGPVPPSLVPTLLHDLNAPLQTVIGFAELLLGGHSEGGGPTGGGPTAGEESAGGETPRRREREFLGRILGAGWEMARLLRATATLCDPVGPGSVEGTAARAGTVLATAAREAGEGDPEPGLSVRVDAPEGLPAIRGRADRLVQATRYLMERAAGGGGCPERRVSVRARLEGSDVIVEIEGPATEDAGPAGELLPEDVEAVSRGRDARERRRLLEVVTARRILRAHGGSVALESAPKGGGRLRIVLPAIGGER